MRSRIIFFLFFSLFVLSLQAQKNEQALPSKTRILFLLDASGSMLGPWENTRKIIAAKRLLSEIVDSLRNNTQVELALRVYGHQFDRRQQRCDDSRLMVPFAPGNNNRIIKTLGGIKPKGNTPIAYSLEQTQYDFPNDPSYRNIVILLTDGIESCDGDPCAVSLALQKRGVFLKPFIIGLGMDQDYQDAFGCMGRYYDARNIQQFRTALDQAINQTLKKTTVSIELLDQDEQPTESNVNITFLNSFTQEPKYEFVHYRDEQGRPDSLQVEPVLTYDLIANTIPPVRKNNIVLNAGEHNIIKMVTPQGNLKVEMPGYREYKEGVKVLVYDKKGQLLNTQGLYQNIRYLTGAYKVEVLSLPRRVFIPVEIEEHRTKTLTLDAPGLLNLNSPVDGYGSLFEVKDNGSQNWIMNLDALGNQITLTMQPGNYKLVYRAREAKGSKYTAIRTFKIRSGQTTLVNFFK